MKEARPDEGMWSRHEHETTYGDYAIIKERRNNRDVVITNMLDKESVERIVEAHNQVVEKLNETNILEAIKTCDLTIKKAGCGNGNDDAILKVGKPNRVILEYDIDKVTQRRIIMNDKSCVIEDMDRTVEDEG